MPLSAAPRRDGIHFTTRARPTSTPIPSLYATAGSGLPTDAEYASSKAPSCPHCKLQLSAVIVAKEQAEMEAMSLSQLAEHLLRHRQSHAGKEKHAEIEVLMDHVERAPSLLHHRINSCETSTAVSHFLLLGDSRHQQEINELGAANVQRALGHLHHCKDLA
eukprot:6211875-Pleurochrysis_carterae.AAC.1